MDPKSKSLSRFIEAQEPVYSEVCKELAAGRKESRWIWFVFPQLQSLGRSSTAQYFGLQTTWWALLAATSIAEAHEQLRQREEISLVHPGWIGTEPAKRRYPHHQSISTWMSQRSLDVPAVRRYASDRGTELNAVLPIETALWPLRMNFRVVRTSTWREGAPRRHLTVLRQNF